jgi:hypothetical protein
VFRSADGINFSMINTALVTQLVFDDPIPNDRGYYYALGLVYRGAPPVSSAALSANSAKTVIVDSDSDGVPEWWMVHYFGHATGQAGDLSRAQDDADADGMSNLQEFRAGTNPTNSASVFRVVSIAPQGTNMLVTWQAGAGRTNVVQAAGVVSGSYSNLSPNIVLPGSGDVVTNYLDNGAGTNRTSRFYKIRVGP